jgi:hypothetical protein
MKEDAKILMADTSMMDDDVKAWYMMVRAHIMEHMKAAATHISSTSLGHHSRLLVHFSHRRLLHLRRLS